jgi:hypothetical protein
MVAYPVFSSDLARYSGSICCATKRRQNTLKPTFNYNGAATDHSFESAVDDDESTKESTTKTGLLMDCDGTTIVDRNQRRKMT